MYNCRGVKSRPYETAFGKEVFVMIWYYIRTRLQILSCVWHNLEHIYWKLPPCSKLQNLQAPNQFLERFETPLSVL